ncbi:M48 family metalloprotease [Lentzea sp. NBRC 102530]|uniref:M48 family metalloprotease n=1 Tax=Lentzea sp. NBRC 102530 TaxID=3032201 RepID=UPI0024A01553|nr:M48 family metalloprotease [Lentzea sp. NBRC 102530]GLY51020.1 peptidase M48 [Lentzea sp. NBRC 102530]
MRVPRRRFHVSALTELLLGVPTVLSSLLIVGLIGKAVFPQALWLLPAAWFVSGAFVLLPTVDKLLAVLAHRLRKPTGTESAALQPLLDEVCGAAGVEPGRYWLRVQNSREINAMAVGGHVVGVSTAAMRLPPEQLEAVLAHELGHHLAGHTKISLLRWWYELPARTTVWVVLVVGLGVHAAGRRIGTPAARTISIVLIVVLAVAAVAVSPWVLLVPVIAPLLAWQSRKAELHADRVAAELGYGPLLLEVLQQWVRQGHDLHRARAGVRARMLASHPSCAQRISRLRGR